MPAVPLQCPTCAGPVQIDTSMAGQAVACPHCQAAMVAPPEEMLLEMLAAMGGGSPQAPPFDFGQAAHDELLTLGCPVCSGPFQVPAAMAGQQVGCPHCGAPVTIPGAEPAMPGSFDPFAMPAPFAPPPMEPAAIPESESLTAPTFDDLLPPGAAPASRAPRQDRQREPKRQSPNPAADDLLPPTRQPARDRSQKPEQPEQDDRLPPPAKPAARPRDFDDLLPPGAAAPSLPASTLQPATQPSAKKVRPAPPLDDLLPPGAAVPPPASPPVQPSSIDSLLPPGAADAIAAPISTVPVVSAIDSLLPPGAASEASPVAGEQVAIPTAPKRSPTRHLNAPAGAIVVPTPDGGFVSVRETPKVVGEGDDALELKRLSAQERAKRRLRNNLIFGAFCLLILFVVLVIMLR